MNMSANIKRVLLASAGTALLAVPATAIAAGVPAGTPIANTAEATFTVGGETQTIPSNTVIVTVDEIIDVTVSSLDAGNVPLGNEEGVLTFLVTNIGNGPEAYRIDIDPLLAGDDFDPSIVRIAYDSNGNGTYEEGEDELLPASGITPEIAADDALRIFVIGALAGNPGNGDIANVGLEASATTGTGDPGTVFEGAGVDGSDAVIGTTTAFAESTGAFQVAVSTVTLTKAAAVLDPFGGSQPVPGALVTYTLVASVAGASSVSGLTINDPVPANTTYAQGTLTLDGGVLTDLADTDAGTADAAAISVALGTVAGGNSHTITFQVTIDD